MDSLKYLLFSTIEFTGVFVLTLALFRMRILAHKWEILLSSFLCSIVSLLLYRVDLHNIGIAIQMFCDTLCFIFIFKTSVRRSVPASIFGYCAFLAIQNIFLLLLIMYKIIDVSNLVPDTPLTYLLQVSSVVLIYTVSLAVKKTNQGFGYFVEKLFDRTKTSVVFVITTLGTAIITGISYYIFFKDKALIFFVIMISLIVVITSIMSYYFIKHDNKLYKLN